MKFTYSILILSAICFSCTEKKSKTYSTSTEKQLVKKDSVKPEIKEIKIISKKNEKTENLNKIIEKFGEQWDFCKCVTANDSINSSFEKNLNDSETNKLMKRWENVELKCKEFLTSENKTPEQRIEHELKVKKCLKNASK
jgi:hypothetical protein